MIPWCQRGTVLLRIDGHISESTDLRNITRTVQKMKFYIKNFRSKCDQIHSFQRIWSHLVKKYLRKTLFFVQQRMSKRVKPMPNANQKSKLDFIFIGFHSIPGWKATTRYKKSSYKKNKKKKIESKQEKLFKKNLKIKGIC